MRNRPSAGFPLALGFVVLVAFVAFVAQIISAPAVADTELPPALEAPITNHAELRDRLERLLIPDAEPPRPHASLNELLGVAPDHRNAVTEQLAVLAALKKSLIDRIADAEESIAQLATGEDAEDLPAKRRTIEQSIETARVDLRIAELQSNSLSSLDQRLEAMTEASRRILPTLGQKRAGLRQHAERLNELSKALSAAALRLDQLEDRAAANLLVGFVSERRALTESAGSASRRTHQQANQMMELAQQLVGLADELEETGRNLREKILRSVLIAESAASIDPLFLSHLRSQRRLRKLLNHGLSIPGEDTLQSLIENANRLVMSPGDIGTTADARSALESTSSVQTRLDAILAAETTNLDAWRLAFENEVVTVLSEQASSEARSRAYGFSTEILDDVTSETELAWRQLKVEVQRRRQQVPTLGALFSSEKGRDVLTRCGAALAILGLWFFLQDRASRLSVFLVKSLAKLPAFHGSVGRLVRWFGLFESIYPAVLGLIAVYLATALLGADSMIATPIRVIAVPLLIYVLGRRALTGATRRITRGRPALVELRPATLERLQSTYTRLGLVVTLGAIVDGIARIGIGAGRVVTLVDAAVLAWIAIWAAIEAVRWRSPLAEAWQQLLPSSDSPGIESRLAGWMSERTMGFLLSPLALLRITLTPALGFIANIATDTSLIQSLQTRLFRRRTKKAAPTEEAPSDHLPKTYLDAFPLHPKLGEDDGLIVSRDALVKEVVEQVTHWQESRADGSLVLIGEQGVGKTTLAGLIGKRAPGLQTVQHTLRGKPSRREDLIRALASALELPETGDVETLCQAANAGPERIVLLDEAHNVFLRRVDGYDTYDALVELVNGAGEKIFWVLVFNSFTWRFLNESRGRVRYFRKLMHLPAWSPEEIQDLIRLRHERTGFELEFDELLLSDDHSEAGAISIVEESEGYFRLLWDSSGGNPRIATQLWLSSLSRAGEQKLRVGLFSEANQDTLSDLQDDLLFALAAICQHENLSASELAVVLNMPEQFASFAVQFLAESGFLAHKDGRKSRYTLSPKYYRAVLRTLKNKHLIFD